MTLLRTLGSAAAAAIVLSACAQTPTDRAAPRPDAAAPATAAGPAAHMARMDAHMKAMREMHDKMTRARAPEERNALMAEHMKLMQDGMAMMGGMGGMPGMGAMPGGMAGHQQMMEKRMEMMQSMMQMMMDRMPMAPAR